MPERMESRKGVMHVDAAGGLIRVAVQGELSVIEWVFALELARTQLMASTRASQVPVRLPGKMPLQAERVA